MASATQSDSLARAIDYLGAVEVAPGRYAAQIPSGGRWFTMTHAQMLRWVHAKGRDGFVLMPAWWTPERQFIVRGEDEGRAIYSETAFATHEDAQAYWDEDSDASITFGCKIVTASLETGEEVPA